MSRIPSIVVVTLGNPSMKALSSFALCLLLWGGLLIPLQAARAQAPPPTMVKAVTTPKEVSRVQHRRRLLPGELPAVERLLGETGARVGPDPARQHRRHGGRPAATGGHRHRAGQPPRARPVPADRKVDTWLILPVVICLSQRLSHACLSINLYTVKLRMAH